MAIHFSHNLVGLQRLPATCDFNGSPRILLKSSLPLQLRSRSLQFVACQGDTTSQSSSTEEPSTAEPAIVDDKPDQSVTSSTGPSFPEFPNKDVNRRVAVLSSVAAVGLFLSARLDFGISLRDLTATALPYEEALSNGKPTVVEFYADWCEVCRELAPDVYKVEQQYKDQVNFVMLNVDNTKWEQELDEFGVEGIPHFAFLDKDGNEEGNVVGRLPQKYLLENIEALARGEESIPHARVVGQYSSAEFRKVHQVTDPRSHGQQRVFAVQVFELHRLLKVQKLIAGSPNLLLESSAFVGKSSLKRSTVDNYSSDYVVEPLPHKSSQKDKVEGTAENVVSKTSAPTPPQQHPIQPVGNPSVSSMDPKMNPWAFYQPSAHQWLVPVMTPSEGLVYKPFPAPGFMGPVCGGCGPVGPTSQYHQQGMGMPPGIHYFPPFDGMPMMGPSPTMSGSTVDQLNPFLGSNPYSQTSQPERPRARKQREVQGSTGSSPCERSQGIRMGPLPDGREGRNPPFVPPPTTEVPNDTPPREKQARVIRAVPHRSTSDSAARIFQSIQQERQRSGSS